MTPDPGWIDLSVRLIFTLLACAALGLDRGEQGQPAGLRTLMLVGLAAALAMIAGNILLATGGKAETSFATMDIMRLPLGILTGIGFIGAGSILKRGASIEGLTTAATLWLATVLGLVFGAGLILLGVAGTFAGLFVVTILRWIEARMPQHRRSILTLVADDPEVLDGVTARIGSEAAVRVQAWLRTMTSASRYRMEMRLIWRADRDAADPPAFVRELSRNRELSEVSWRG
jgi:putative Mg2+ transporter-C (MgtC) family protein